MHVQEPHQSILILLVASTLTKNKKSTAYYEMHGFSEAPKSVTPFNLPFKTAVLISAR
jgi:hypothetical protein